MQQAYGSACGGLAARRAARGAAALLPALSRLRLASVTAWEGGGAAPARYPLHARRDVVRAQTAARPPPRTGAARAAGSGRSALPRREQGVAWGAAGAPHTQFRHSLVAESVQATRRPRQRRCSRRSSRRCRRRCGDTPLQRQPLRLPRAPCKQPSRNAASASWFCFGSVGALQRRCRPFAPHHARALPPSALSRTWRAGGPVRRQQPQASALLSSLSVLQASRPPSQCPGVQLPCGLAATHRPPPLQPAPDPPPNNWHSARPQSTSTQSPRPLQDVTCHLATRFLLDALPSVAAGGAPPLPAARVPAHVRGCRRLRAGPPCAQPSACPLLPPCPALCRLWLPGCSPVLVCASAVWPLGNPAAVSPASCPPP